MMARQNTRRGLCERCYMHLPEQRATAAARQRNRRAERIADGRCIECNSQPLDGLRRCGPCYDRHYAVIKRRRQRAKDAVFERYGGYRCACCGETEPLFLSVDHINGGGTTERRALGGDMYTHLARGPARDDLRVLCHNCNRGRWLNGGECPHVG